MEVTAFGLPAVAIIYWLVAHALKNEILTSGRQAFLTTGAMWTLLVVLYAILPGVGLLALTILGGWAATTLFKAGAKDNETK